ncbi:dipeptidyl aminopeptidase IV [Thecamonas trahens ATCC 50062]|uniref:Dipeptidyl aminopeptidase IV n=1 Tax=Thecamonas trahens ATCC 50062 TaxID=461836 RepID=A0A0L0D9Q5_THETB|nr:dipeptidyl aminopeptidase IV [Thecamonas trahens ATCC 50062]KNC48033.1 dipeptidyl aminopeptidase IV [Thecamonas trahens ATCC 50062]|eukprot:XP_013759048.1 dipeptidyl aminopeptidase IV [Thecamonas trahens ATCC 50062]
MLNVVDARRRRSSHVQVLRVAVGGGVVVAVALVVAVLVLGGGSATRGGTDGPGAPTGTVFDVDGYVAGDLVPNSPRFQWMPLGGPLVATAVDPDSGALIAFGSASTRPVELVPASAMADVDAYAVAPDGTKVLLARDAQRLYRHSTSAVYAVYTVASGTEMAVLGQTRLRKAVWAPDGASRLAVVDAAATNLGVVDLDLGGLVTWLTSDGKLSEVLNGVPDWVYEEEVYSADVTLWWSPDGTSLAYLRFDETQVASTGFDVYPGAGPYPERYRYKYPVPGGTNSNVTLWVRNLTEPSPVLVDTLVAGRGTADQYVVQVAWASSSVLTVRVLDRAQQHGFLVAATRAGPGAWTSSVVNELASDTWLELTEPVFFPSSSELGATQTYLDLQPHGNELAVGVFRLDGSTSTAPVAWLDAGAPVTRIVGVSRDGDSVYVETAPTPRTRALVAIRGLGLDPTREATAERLSPADAWASVSLSPTREHYLVVIFGPSVPVYTVHATADDTPLVVLEDNAALATKLTGYALASREFIEVPGAYGGIHNLGYILKPPSFDPSRKYPVLMHQYSGPGSQQVTARYSASWQLALASSEEIIVVCVDGAGTGGRGLTFEHQTYLRLGERELADQLAAAAFVAQLPYVDEDHMALFGWSFGGFVAASAFASPAGRDAFAAIISVAPVTDWRWYDSIYTERYMGTPASNGDGYIATSVVATVAKEPPPASPSTAFLLMAGLADDNVRYTHTAQLDMALVQAGVAFDGFAFPNQNHGINADGAHAHIYRKMTAFLRHHLAPQA